MMSNLQRFLLLFVCLLILYPVFAYDFMVNGIYYNILPDKINDVEVTYKTGKYSGDISIPSEITYMGTTYKVSSIGNGAFMYCSGLASITIPNSVTSIGNSAFVECSLLASVVIPNSVTSIGSHAFSYCIGLTSIKVESGNAKYDSRNNCNAIIETSTNKLIVGCKNTTIPSSVTSIGVETFWGCSGLTSIAIPNSVTSIGEYNQEIKGVTNVEIIPVSA